jgi:hypothetical protein
MSHSFTQQEIENIARICHEANRAYCVGLGDFSQLAWDVCPIWQRDSAINGVRFHLEHPSAKDSESHENWLNQKIMDGWHYGPVKDEKKKEHPCMVTFEALPPEQQRKDRLFRMIVRALCR